MTTILMNKEDVIDGSARRLPVAGYRDCRCAPSDVIAMEAFRYEIQRRDYAASRERNVSASDSISNAQSLGDFIESQW